MKHLVEWKVLGELSGLEISYTVVGSSRTIIGQTFFPFTLIVQWVREVREEMIAALISIVTVANLYFIFYTHKTPATFIYFFHKFKNFRL